MQTCDAGLLAFLAVVAILVVIGQWWTGGPNWVRESFAPDVAPTTLEKVLDTVSMLLLVAAIYFYFSGRLSPDAAAGPA